MQCDRDCGDGGDGPQVEPGAQLAGPGAGGPVTAELSPGSADQLEAGGEDEAKEAPHGLAGGSVRVVCWGPADLYCRQVHGWLRRAARPAPLDSPLPGQPEPQPAAAQESPARAAR